jgi:hypothetical protein
MGACGTEAPDLLGMELAGAERLLAGAGLPFRVVETAPPRGKLAEGRLCVVRLRFDAASGCLELTVCRV